MIDRNRDDGYVKSNEIRGKTTNHLLSVHLVRTDGKRQKTNNFLCKKLVERIEKESNALTILKESGFL
jgi:hypothetical protein